MIKCFEGSIWDMPDIIHFKSCYYLPVFQEIKDKDTVLAISNMILTQYLKKAKGTESFFEIFKDVTY
jgi:hypothetical protein